MAYTRLRVKIYVPLPPRAITEGKTNADETIFTIPSARLRHNLPSHQQIFRRFIARLRHKHWRRIYKSFATFRRHFLREEFVTLQGKTRQIRRHPKF
jgi:hypothetical protein